MSSTTFLYICSVNLNFIESISSNGTWYFKSFCFSKTFKNHYMIKYLKSVGVLLFLSTVCNGTVYANQEGRKTDVRVTQQMVLVREL